MSTATEIKHNIVYNDGDPSSAVIYLNGEEYIADKTHRNFDKIIEALKGEAHPDEIVALFDIAIGIKTKFARLSERMTITDGKILFDGEQEETFMTEMILGFYDQGLDDWQPIVAFREKVAQNPNKHSQEQLFRWLTVNKFSIDNEGNIIAYKGVERRTGLHADDMKYSSVHSGRALVNGQWVDGKIPTNPGTIVEMPRSEVQHDPSVGCHKGLHAGDWSYASSFAQITLRVQINPRDVVSVPTDCGDRKMRVCRYRVLNQVTSQDRDMLLTLDERELRTRAIQIEKPKANKTTTIITDAEIVKAKKVAPVKAAPKAKPVKPEAAKKAPVKAAKVAKTSKKAATKAAPKVSEVTKQAVKAVKAVKATPKPKFYEEFKRPDFLGMSFNQLRWLAGEWEIKTGSNPNKAQLVDALTKTAAHRNRKFTKGTLDSKPVKVK
jgi:hypothetical protein